jgi:hypothetical protein
MLTQAKKANDDMLKKLKEAENAKFAKEGEVSLLRRNIDKVRFIVATNHFWYHAEVTC